MAGKSALFPLHDGEIIPIRFGPDASSGSKYSLFEIPPAMLPALSAGGSLTIKGEEKDEAVLVTENETFALRTIETTNTLVIVEPDGTIASSTGKTVVELVRCAPRVERIREILMGCLYTQSSCSDFGVPLEELHARVQASAREIEVELARLGAFELRGRWTLISDEHVFYALGLALCHAAVKDWPLTAPVPLDECCSDLKDEVDPAVTRQVILTHSVEGQPGLFSHRLVCRSKARELILSKTNASWRVDEFSAKWAEQCPEVFPPDMAMLRGIALIEDVGRGPAAAKVLSFPVSSLPLDPRLRFKDLFSVKPKWSLAEITPYVADLVIPGMTNQQVLFKYAREITYDVDAPRDAQARADPEKRMFCARVVS